MDLILEVADTLVLDSLWAKLVPLSSTLGLEGATSSSVLSNVTGSAVGSRSWLNEFAHTLPSSLQPPSTASLLLAKSTKDPILTVAQLPAFVSRILPDPASTGLSAWPRDYILRQTISVFFLTLLGIHALYFIFAGLSYVFIFDKRVKRHPRYLKNQISMEIACSLWAFPGMTVMTMPWFIGEVRGWSKLYDDVNTYGIWYMVATVPLFLLFTDFCIYWIHRWLHLPVFYKYIHKPHHKWVIPTPFASHAFHAIDGYSQSVPYHLFIYLVPMHRALYLGLFVAVNFWSIFIHDSDMFVSPGSKLEAFINTPAHHTLHHIYFTCNYGQYFTWADRNGGSYKAPGEDLDPLKEVLAMDAKLAREKNQ